MRIILGALRQVELMAEIDSDIKEAGWDAVQTVKNRVCLMCSGTFESAWAGERICKKCKSQASWRKGDTSLSN